MLQQIGILTAAFVGFGIAWHIWRTKAQNKKLKCFIGEDCNRVVQSRFSSVFGVWNEVLGMVYYTALIAVYGLGIAGLHLLPQGVLLPVSYTHLTLPTILRV